MSSTCGRSDEWGMDVARTPFRPGAINGPWSPVWSSSSQWLFLATGTDLVGYRVGDPIGFPQINVFPGRAMDDGGIGRWIGEDGQRLATASVPLSSISR